MELAKLSGYGLSEVLNRISKLKPRGIQNLKKLGVKVFDSITPLAIYEQKPY